MADEMYLDKGTQFHGGQYIGADEDGALYKGVVVFMIVGLKKSIPIVVKATPEKSVHGDWVAKEMVCCVETLSKAGFNVRAIVTDNHSANVRAFNKLLDLYGTKDGLFLKHPQSKTKTYLFLIQFIF